MVSKYNTSSQAAENIIAAAKQPNSHILLAGYTLAQADSFVKNILLGYLRSDEKSPVLPPYTVKHEMRQIIFDNNSTIYWVAAEYPDILMGLEPSLIFYICPPSIGFMLSRLKSPDHLIHVT